MFITFRTADSMPKEVSIRWQRELEHWLTANQLPLALAASTAVKKTMRHDDMIEKMSAAQRREFKKLSDRFFQRSLDNCHGKCLLKRAELAEIVGNAMLFYNEEKYDLDRFVVMPNHVHAIVQFRIGASLGVVSQSWMRYTARQINMDTSDSGEFWQPERVDKHPAADSTDLNDHMFGFWLQLKTAVSVNTARYRASHHLPHGFKPSLKIRCGYSKVVSRCGSAAGLRQWQVLPSQNRQADSRATTCTLRRLRKRRCFLAR